MTENNKKKSNDTEEKSDAKASGVTADQDNNKKADNKITIEEKLKIAEDKLLRSLAEIENQEDLKKEIKDAFEFGSLILQKKV